MNFVVDAAEGVTRFRRPETRFLSTGFDGGSRRGDAAYNLTVPEGWGDDGPRDLRTYVDERLAEAGFSSPCDAPALLTGVDQGHARAARLDGVVTVATVGLSNPAALPVDAASVDAAESADAAEHATATPAASDEDRSPVGTVNLLVGTTRSLSSGALANLVAVAAEAKATTLLATSGFPGTTSDAIVVGSAIDGDPAEFSGSATPVGDATRVCVRDAVLASLRSRYADEPIPASIEDATYGVVTDRRADVTPIEGT